MLRAENTLKSQKSIESLLWNEIGKEFNQICADCGDSDPEWASINLGVLICQRCSSVHRFLGVGVSRIKSLSLDQWDVESVKAIQCRGNQRVNQEFERSLTSGIKPRGATATHEQRLAFITAKYVDMKYKDGCDASKCSAANNQSTDSCATIEEALPVRLVDYFAVIGIGDLIEPNSQFTKSEFSSQVLDKFPVQDYADTPFPGEVICQFCFPTNARVKHQQSSPRRFAFCLTSDKGVRQYVVAIKFWEPLDAMGMVALEANYITQHTSNDSTSCKDDESVYRSSCISEEVFAPKLLLIISHWPFINQFSCFLASLYRLSRSLPPLPLERYISNFVSEVPLPPAGCVTVQYLLADIPFRISRPPPNELPLCDIRMSTLFHCLDLNNIVALVISFVTEQQIVLCSSHWSVLLDVAEAISTLVFPFSWQGVYIPVLPRSMKDFIYAPVPFIVGIHTSYLIDLDMPKDIVFVNLDRNEVLTPSATTLPTLPEKKIKKLFEQLKSCTNQFQTHSSLTQVDFDVAFPYMEHEERITNFSTSGGLVVQDNTADSLHKISTKRKFVSPKKKFIPTDENELDVVTIRNAFSRFFVAVLLRYRSCMVPANACGEMPDELFDVDTFISGAPEAHKPLLRAITCTQLFERFVRDRWTPHDKHLNATNPEVQLFDELIVAKLNRSKISKRKSTPFLDCSSYTHSKTFVVQAPNADGVSVGAYEYTVFPRLNANLYGATRMLRPLVKQANLRQVNTMARRVNAQLMRGDRVRGPQFQSWECLKRSAVIIQSSYRRHVVWRYFRRCKKYCILIQARFRFVRCRRSARLLQCAGRAYFARAHQNLARFALAATVLSSALHALICYHTHTHHIIAITTLVAALTPICSRVRFNNTIRRVVRVQTRFRGRIALRNYTRIRHYIIIVQAKFRGAQQRRHQAVVIDEGINVQRTILVELWQTLHVPLTTRSQFWQVFNDRSYLSLFMHLEEVQTLRQSVTHLSATMNANNSVSANTDTNTHTHGTFRDVNAERNMLYKRLKKNVSANARNEMFALACINGKKRKRRLAHWVWTSRGYEDVSAHIVLRVLRDDSAQMQRKRDRVRRRMRETTECSLRAVQRLSHCVAQLRNALTQQRCVCRTLLRKNAAFAQRIRESHTHTCRIRNMSGYRPRFVSQ